MQHRRQRPRRWLGDRHHASSSVIAVALATAAALPAVTLAGWEMQSPPTSVDLYDITAHHASVDIAWACGAGGTILFTSDGGTSWTLQESGTTSDLHGIAFQEITDGPVVAVGANGTILRTTDQGTSWVQLASGTTETLRCISDFGFFIVGDAGTTLRSTDLGQTWSPVDSSSMADLHSVSGPAPTFAVGKGGAILFWNGSVWSPRQSGTTADLFGTPLFPQLYVTGSGGLILRSTNGGADWAPLAVGTTAALRDIELSTNNTSRLYAVGDGGTILKTTDHGATWGFQPSGTLADLQGVFFYLNDAQGWAVGAGGTILRTDDGGGEPVAGLPPAPPGSAPRLRLSCYPNPFRTQTTLVVGLDRPGRLVLEVFDPAGRRVGGWGGEAVAGGDHRIPLDLDPSLAAGVYFVRLATPGGIRATRLLRVR